MNDIIWRLAHGKWQILIIYMQFWAIYKSKLELENLSLLVLTINEGNANITDLNVYFLMMIGRFKARETVVTSPKVRFTDNMAQLGGNSVII